MSYNRMPCTYLFTTMNGKLKREVIGPQLQWHFCAYYQAWPCSGWWIVDHSYWLIFCNGRIGCVITSWAYTRGVCWKDNAMYIWTLVITTIDSSYTSSPSPSMGHTVSSMACHLTFFFTYTVMKISRISTYPRKTWIYYYRGINGICSN